MLHSSSNEETDFRLLFRDSVISAVSSKWNVSSVIGDTVGRDIVGLSRSTARRMYLSRGIAGSLGIAMTFSDMFLISCRVVSAIHSATFLSGSEISASESSSGGAECSKLIVYRL